MSINPTHLSPACSCIICHKEYSAKGIFSHFFASHNMEGIKIMADVRKKGTAVTFGDRLFQEKFKKPKKEKPKHKCFYADCNNETSNKFCSQSCAAKHNNTLRPAGHSSRITPESNRGKNIHKSIIYSKISWCVVCGKVIRNSHRKTCSDNCKSVTFQNGGIKSASVQVKRSVDEIKLFNLCKSHFYSVRNNEPLIDGWDADIIIDDIKTAILWNGPWHYKQMPHKNHSLPQVQNRDKIKISKLKENGWTVLIYEDRFHTPLSAFNDILSVVNVAGGSLEEPRKSL